MEKFTQWSPDTCGCVIVYRWDDQLPSEERVHTYHESIKSCPVHQQHHGHAEHHRTVTAENQRKNLVFAHAEELVPGITSDAYTWSYDAHRVLQARLSHPSLTDTHKQAIQARIDLNHGPGQVRVS